MSTDEGTHDPVAPDDPAGDEPPQTVFGNLPHSRPGARSSVRDQPARRTRAKPARSAPGAKEAAAAEQGPPPRRPQPEDAAEPAAGGGIEDVAWAGVAAAAEAATIGVRLATRALEAMRDAVDRR